MIFLADVESIIGGGTITASINSEGAVGASSAVSNLLGALQWSGFAISVGALMYLGIKYVLSAAEDKAAYKKLAGRYVMGVLLIAGASLVIAILRGFIE